MLKFIPKLLSEWREIVRVSSRLEPNLQEIKTRLDGLLNGQHSLASLYTKQNKIITGLNDASELRSPQTCKICGSRTLMEIPSFVREGRTKSFHKCTICDFAFDYANNKKESYPDDYFDVYVVDETIRRMRHEEARWIAEKFNMDGKNYLEIGPGLGQFMEEIKACSNDIRLNVVEMGGRAAEVCRQLGANVIEGDWENLPYSALLPYYQQCDMIASIHCIEHMDEPLAALRKMAWLLKPGGLLYIHTPDHDTATDEHWFHYHPEHISMFGDCSLRVGFDLAGLSVVGARKLYGGDLIVYGIKKA